jgi:hypothetical protein
MGQLLVDEKSDFAGGSQMINDQTAALIYVGAGAILFFLAFGRMLFGAAWRDWRINRRNRRQASQALREQYRQSDKK